MIIYIYIINIIISKKMEIKITQRKKIRRIIRQLKMMNELNV